MSRDPAPPASATSAFRQGQLRLLDTLGSGGFGTVYRAEIVGEMGFRKPVAVKVLSDEGSNDADIVSRLRDEARILGLLRHRSIVGVDDLLRVNGRWAVVMELVDGEDLAQLMERGPMPPRVVAEICRESALALSAAHTACHPSTGEPLQVIHRDIKPANIKVSGAGEVKVLDFGVARARFASREAETRAIRFGSPGYIAPERFDGEDSVASDVYSLGAVLIECLLGERLGRLPMSRSQHPLAVERALSRVQGLGPDLAEIAKAMLAYEPEDRPSAGEVARRLRVAALSGEGPWLSEWAPAMIASIRGGTEPRLAPASADTLDIPPASAPVFEALPPLTAEEGVQARLVSDEGPSGSGPAPSSQPFAAAELTFDEPVLGSLSVPIRDEGPSLGLTGPLPEVSGREADEEAPAPKAGLARLAAVAVLLVLVGVGAVVALNRPSADPQGEAALGPEVAVEPAPADPTGVPAAQPGEAAPTPAAASAGEPAAGAAVTGTPPTGAAASGAPAAGAAATKAPATAKPANPKAPPPEAAPPVAPPVAAPPVTAPEAEPLSAPRGTVVVTGQVDELVLYAADGSRVRPGRVDVGRYEVAWRFGEGELVRAGVSVTVAEGQVVTLFCGASTGSCRVLK